MRACWGKGIQEWIPSPSLVSRVPTVVARSISVTSTSRCLAQGQPTGKPSKAYGVNKESVFPPEGGQGCLLALPGRLRFVRIMSWLQLLSLPSTESGMQLASITPH